MSRAKVKHQLSRSVLKVALIILCHFLIYAEGTYGENNTYLNQQIEDIMKFNSTASKPSSIVISREDNKDDSQGEIIWLDKLPAWAIALSSFVMIAQILTVLLASFFTIAVFKNPKARSQSYNIYVVFLVIPDIILNISSISCNIYMIAIRKTLVPSFLGIINIWIAMFYYFGNFYLNSFIAHNIHDLVKKSYRRIKIGPPTIRRVSLHISLAYAIGGLLATWYCLPTKWSVGTIVDSQRQTFMAGSPGEGGVFPPPTAKMITYTITVIPIIYVLYIYIDIWWRRLLPISGRTRVLWQYFSRILNVFFLYYIPVCVVTIARAQATSENVLIAIDITLRIVYVLQALTNIFLALKKDSIKRAYDIMFRKIWKFVTCGSKKKPSFRKLAVSLKSLKFSSLFTSGDAFETEKTEQSEESEAEISPSCAFTVRENGGWESQDVYGSSQRQESHLQVVPEGNEEDCDGDIERV